MNHFDTTFLTGYTWRMYKFWVTNAFTFSNREIWKFNKDGTGQNGVFHEGKWTTKPIKWGIEQGQPMMRGNLNILYLLSLEPDDELGIKNTNNTYKCFCRRVSQTHNLISSEANLYGVWRRTRIGDTERTWGDDNALWRFNPDNTATFASKFNGLWVIEDKTYTLLRKNGIIYITGSMLTETITLISVDEICIASRSRSCYFRRVGMGKDTVA